MTPLSLTLSASPLQYLAFYLFSPIPTRTINNYGTNSQTAKPCTEDRGLAVFLVVSHFSTFIWYPFPPPTKPAKQTTPHRPSLPAPVHDTQNALPLEQADRATTSYCTVHFDSPSIPSLAALKRQASQKREKKTPAKVNKPRATSAVAHLFLRKRHHFSL